MPRESQTTTSRTPARWSRRVTATPAAPAPETTTRRSGRVRRRTRTPLSSPASTTIAVPCWSSWKTGMSSRSLSCSSMSKQRGAEMSSRLMPPKDGAMRTIASTSSSAVPLSMTTGMASMPGEVLEEHRLALHDRHGPERPDVAEAEHRGSVADDGDGVAARGVPGRERRVGRDGEGHLGDARRVEQGQVVPVAQRLRRVYPQLPALVSAEDRALGVEERDVGRRCHGNGSSRGWHGARPRRAGGQGCGPRGVRLGRSRSAGVAAGRWPSWHARPAGDRHAGVTQVAPRGAPTRTVVMSV